MPEQFINPFISIIMTMARVSTYLNFKRNTEEAFTFYKSVFGTEFEGEGFNRFSQIPPHEGMTETPAEDLNLVMHVSLPILGGHRLMGTDSPESMGFQLKEGNNVSINLEPDSREETDRLYAALSDGGTASIPPQEMFWGAYFGACVDKYGINWMFNCAN